MLKKPYSKNYVCNCESNAFYTLYMKSNFASGCVVMTAFLLELLIFSGGPLTPIISNMTAFNQSSHCMDNNPGTVCTNVYGAHPFIIFDLGTPLAAISSASVRLG
jgi:hypothetical protein